MENDNPDGAEIFELLDRIVFTLWVNGIAYITNIIMDIVAWCQSGFKSLVIGIFVVSV